jgi:hypothetical protein
LWQGWPEADGPQIATGWQRGGFGSLGSSGSSANHQPSTDQHSEGHMTTGNTANGVEVLDSFYSFGSRANRQHQHSDGHAGIAETLRGGGCGVTMEMDHSLDSVVEGDPSSHTSFAMSPEPISTGRLSRRKKTLSLSW